MTILQDFSEKIKDRGLGVFVMEIIAITAFGVASFSLGIYSAKNSSVITPNSISIVYPNDPLLASKYKPIQGNSTQATSSNTKIQPTSASDIQASYLGSVNGTKYYPIGCSGANRIKPENQILFATQDEAEQSGYTQSTTCTY